MTNYSSIDGPDRTILADGGAIEYVSAVPAECRTLLDKLQAFISKDENLVRRGLTGPTLAEIGRKVQVCRIPVC